MAPNPFIQETAPGEVTTNLVQSLETGNSSTVSATQQNQLAVAASLALEDRPSAEGMSVAETAVISGAIDLSTFANTQMQSIQNSIIEEVIQDTVDTGEVSSTSEDRLLSVSTLPELDPDSLFDVATLNAINPNAAFPTNLDQHRAVLSDDGRRLLDNAMLDINSIFEEGDDITYPEMIAILRSDDFATAQKYQLSRAFTYAVVGRIMQDADWLPSLEQEADAPYWGVINDFLATMITGTSKDRYDVTNVYGLDLTSDVDFEVTDNWFWNESTADNSFPTIVSAFNAASPAKQAIMMPALAQMVVEQSDFNTIQATQLLQQILNPIELSSGRAELALDLGFGLMDGLAALQAAKSLVTALRIRGNAKGINFAANWANNPSKAGEMNAAVLLETSDTGGAAARTANTSPIVATGNTRGFNRSSTLGDGAATDGIAPSSVTVLEENERAIAVIAEEAKRNRTRNTGIIEDIAKSRDNLKRGALRPDEREAAAAYVLDNIATIARQKGIEGNLVAGAEPRIVGLDQSTFIVEVTTSRNTAASNNTIIVDGDGIVRLDEADPAAMLADLRKKIDATEALLKGLKAGELTETSLGVTRADIVSEYKALVKSSRELQRRAMADGSFNTQRIEVQIRADQISGGFAVQDLGYRNNLLGRGLLSPRGLFGNMIEGGEDLVSALTTAGLQFAKMNNANKRMFARALRGISAPKEKKVIGPGGAPMWEVSGQEKISHILLQGDKAEKVFTDAELAAGVVTAGGKFRLTPREIAAYRDLRQIAKIAHDDMDKVLVETATFDGALEYTITAGNDGSTRAVLIPVSKGKGVASNRTVYDTRTGQAVKAGSKEYDQAIAEGRVLAKTYFEDVVSVPDRDAKGRLRPKSYRHFLVDPNQGKEVQRVLRQRPGYITRERVNVNWAIREQYQVRVDGVMETKWRTHTLTARRDVAERVKAERELELKATKDGSLATDRVYLVPADLKGFMSVGASGEDAARALRELQIESYGGNIYTSSRSTRDIVFEHREGGLSQRDAISAIYRNIASASKQAAHNPFKLQSIHKWKLTAIDPRTGKSFLKDPDDWMSELSLETPTALREMLEETRTYLSQEMSIVSEEDSLFTLGMKRAGERLETHFNKDTTNLPSTTFFGMKIGGSSIKEDSVWKDLPEIVSGLGAKYQQTDVVGFARTLTFHPLLGLYNVSAGLVQAFGALTPTLIHPLYGGRAFARYYAARSVMFAENMLRANKEIPESFYNEFFALMAENATKAFKKLPAEFQKPFKDGSELRAMVQEFRKSGLADSLMSQADVKAAAEGFSMNPSVVGKLVEKGTLPFAEGEWFNRWMGWSVAWDEVASSFPNGMPLSNGILPPDVFNEVMDKSRAFSLNLDKANEAKWQKFVPTKLATTFMQVGFKWTELALGLDPGIKGQRAKLLIGQALVGGSKGLAILGPFAAYAVSQGILGMGEGDQKSLPRELQVLIDQGGLPYMLYLLSDGQLDLEISQRTMLPTTLTDLVIGLSGADDFRLLDIALGATGSVSDRFGDAMYTTGILFDRINSEDIDLTRADILTMLGSYASIASSVRNLQVGSSLFDGEDGWKHPRTGITILNPEDVTDMEAVAQILGFAPRVRQSRYQANLTMSQIRDMQKDATDALTTEFNLVFSRYSDASDLPLNEARRLAFVRDQMLRDLPPKSRVPVWDAVKNRLSATESATRDAVIRLFQMVERGADPAQSMVTPPTATMALPRPREERE